ncbi:hypothetical protein [uncultured Shewanella sp.]|uniref:hypothetical protein n=1 Tax=uncultured Shewanella sp. TaxID=173975 RepID=UPI002637E103|nr:hypothetical protein [uncultured Shewanella sp.]
MAFTHAFTDVHGLTHTAAIMAISYIGRSGNTSTELQLNGDTYQSNMNNYHNINYRVVYWPDQAKKDEGALPMEYIHSDNSRDFNSQITEEAGLDNDALVLLAETHFKESVLNIAPE